ncbi:MAG TPA: hypothetical protein VD999_00350 [Vitreimonas sp.]|nr:hypothetical protein [Vitreimonas sp.]
MKKINIRIPASLATAFQARADKEGITKSSLLRQWLQQPLLSLPLNRLEAGGFEINYSIQLEPSLFELLQKLSQEFDLTLNRLVQAIIQYHLTAEFNPHLNTPLVHIPKNAEAFNIKGKDRVWQLYLELIKDQHIFSVTDSKAIEEMFPGNFFDYVYATQKGYLKARSITLDNEPSRNFLRNASAVLPSYQFDHKLFSTPQTLNCVGYITTPNKTIIVRNEGVPSAVIMNNKQLASYSLQVFKLLWQSPLTKYLNYA